MAFLPAGGILGSVIVVVGEFQSGQDVVEFAALDAFIRQKSESHRQLQDRNAQSKTPHPQPPVRSPAPDPRSLHCCI